MPISEPENLYNLFSLYRSAGDNHMSTVVTAFDGYKIIAAEGSAWPNMGFDIDEGKFGEQLVESVTVEMNSLGLRPTLILDNNASWLKILKGKGFLPVDQWSGMRYDLTAVQTPFMPDSAGSTSIINDDEMSAWTEVVAETLFEKKGVNPEIFNGLRSKGATMIGLKVENELAGSSMIYIDDCGRAGIYMVGVREKYRGKGWGKVIVGDCLTRIREMGKSSCCLQSTRMGLGLYKSLGFKESDKYFICCKIK